MSTDERNDAEEKVEEVILPGFRFHPTDEELVGFYLKKKVQQKPLSIELIRQLNIYKYDPWDLPKLATTGEKEWYFYCPRDRKYRNSARPNRVTGAGFWKATGTDRPIYSSEGSKCIGLKKSLVFYKGRAAKGVKTDWMMHEFRLPSLTDHAASLPKRPIDKNIPANDSWAICRIFKKTNSMAQRALSHSWVSPTPEAMDSNMFSVSCTTDAGSTIQFHSNNDMHQQQLQTLATMTCPVPLEVTNYKPHTPLASYKTTPSYAMSNLSIPTSFMFSPSIDMSIPPKCSADVASLLLNLPPAFFGDIDHKPPSCIDFGQQQQQQQLQQCCNNFAMDLPPVENANMHSAVEAEIMSTRKNMSFPNYYGQWGTTTVRANSSYPIGVNTNISDAWKSNPSWGDSPQCPSEVSTNYSTKCAILD